MSQKRRGRKFGRKKLQQVIDLCDSVKKNGLDPFLVDVDDIIAIVKEYFPEWNLPEDLCLDAEVIHKLSSVIELQGNWVKNRSTSLYIDPFLLKEKIMLLKKEDFYKLFLKVWNPIVESEQLSPKSLSDAVEYWRNLTPLNERWLQTSYLEKDIESVTREEMIKERLFSETSFLDELEVYWEELKLFYLEEGKIRYWNFISSDTYSETIKRAYIVAFLVTYGYATLEIYRLKEEIFIIPFDKPKSLLKQNLTISIPISIAEEEWMKWKKEEKFSKGKHIT